DGETLDVSELVATFQGAQSLSVSALLEQGYLSYSKIEDKHVHGLNWMEGNMQVAFIPTG
ncbi:MAG: hypothetical protein F6K62_06185, partial [Sphaerospermopsis sp. SIO1G2]|nr:hypothetical protein [Sphaerospermopsis sp. SIO1G2]